MIRNVNEVTESHWGPVLHVRGALLNEDRRREEKTGRKVRGVGGWQVHQEIY